MKSGKDVSEASARFTDAHPDLGPEIKAVPMTRREAREEMQGLPRYPARFAPPHGAEPAAAAQSCQEA